MDVLTNGGSRGDARIFLGLAIKNLQLLYWCLWILNHQKEATSKKADRRAGEKLEVERGPAGHLEAPRRRVRGEPCLHPPAWRAACRRPLTCGVHSTCALPPRTPIPTHVSAHRTLMRCLLSHLFFREFVSVNCTEQFSFYRKWSGCQLLRAQPASSQEAGSFLSCLQTARILHSCCVCS